MEIRYQDYGAVVNIVITSTILEFRKHNRVVDAMLLYTPDIIITRTGMFLMKTALSGKSRGMLHAYKTTQREAIR